MNGDPAQDTVTYKSTEKVLEFYDGGNAGSGRTRTLTFGLRMKSTGSITSETNAVYGSDGAGHLSRWRRSGRTGQEFDVLLVGATAATVGASLYTSDIVPAVTWFNAAG